MTHTTQPKYSIITFAPTTHNITAHTTTNTHPVLGFLTIEHPTPDPDQYPESWGYQAPFTTTTVAATLNDDGTLIPVTALPNFQRVEHN